MKQKFNFGFKPLQLVISVLAPAIMWMMPVPHGLEIHGWHLLAIFIGTILAIITEAVPMGVAAMTAIAVTAVSGILAPGNPGAGINMALSGFSNSVIWLIVLAFFISRGFVKTGLGKRIAYIFVRFFGRRTLGLSYSLLFADLVLAPAIPSNTARGGGIIYPIIKSLSNEFNSNPADGTEKKLGSFLITAAFQGNIITSTMFMTAMAANPLAAKLASQAGVDMTWTAWAVAAIVPGIISLLVIPLVIYFLYPPQMKATPAAAEIAQKKLRELGPLSGSEIVMSICFVMLLTLWIAGRHIGVDATVAALLGLLLLLFSGILTWDDIKSEKGAWDTLVWFAALVMMAGFLNKLGVISWFGAIIKHDLTGVSPALAFPLLILIYVYVHYFFASSTAHVAALFPVFLGTGMALGVNGLLMALSLGFASNLCASTTHYGCGPAPVFFGSGFVKLKTWWLIGLIVSIINMLIWFGLGPFYWKALGLG
ncbi:MAG: anion permease [Lentisphaerae bacterium]|nr:anion permease [Lentisphaerota bacterium]MCP4103556.1 anion permease [Lentisphaerota bacterium]